MRTTLLIALLAVPLDACRHSRVPPVSAVDVATRRAELERASRAAAAKMSSGEFVTPFTALFAPLGVYVNAGPLSSRGPASARAWLERDMLNSRSTARWTVLRHDVSADGQDGYTFGYFDVFRPHGDTLPGKYHAYWRRTADGVWQLLAFSRGRRAPGPITETLPATVATAVTHAPSSGKDSVALLREVMDTERAFAEAVGSGVQAAFTKYAAPDAAKLDGGPAYAFGRQEISALFAGAPPGAGPLWTPEIGSVASSGDLGFTTGPVVARPGGSAPPPGAKYFTIWRRMPGGEWRYVVD